MITLCVLLLVFGLILLVAEMFITGFGVCGISGLVLVVVSAVLAVAYVPGGWLFVSVEMLILAAVIYSMYRFMRSRQLQNNLIMSDTLNEDVSMLGDLDYFVGKEGISKTPLRPFGEVDFNGVKMEVSSDGAYIETGRRVKVIEVQKTKIIVSPLGQ